MAVRLVALALLSLLASCQGESDGNEPEGTAGSGAGGINNVYVEQIRSADGCLPRQLVPTGDQRIPCSIVEATSTSTMCSCDVAGRMEVASPSIRVRSLERLELFMICGGASGIDCQQLCLCEIEQFAGAELYSCQQDVDTGDLIGFCYLDENEMIGNPELVADCPETQRRRLRFVDPSGNTPQPDATLLIACEGATL